VKRGGWNAFVAENSTTRFFVPKVGITAHSGEFCDVVPSKTETPKTQQTCFGSNGVDWVRSLRKIQLQVFFVTEVAGKFCDVVPSKTETPKTQQT
jgi:hypothetical protein